MQMNRHYRNLEVVHCITAKCILVHFQAYSRADEQALQKPVSGALHDWNFQRKCKPAHVSKRALDLACQCLLHKARGLTALLSECAPFSLIDARGVSSAHDADVLHVLMLMCLQNAGQDADGEQELPQPTLFFKAWLLTHHA
eukprot:1158482-Pelagomonas_calceolata.AAC.2